MPIRYVVWWRRLQLHAWIWSSPQRSLGKKAMKIHEMNIQMMRLQVGSAGMRSISESLQWVWPAKGGPTRIKSTHELLVCACMCSCYLCSVRCPGSVALNCHFCFKAPCFRQDYISAVKPAEIAFLTLLQGKCGERNERKQSTLKVPIPWKWWQIEQRRVNEVAGCLHWLDITDAQWPTV